MFVYTLFRNNILYLVFQFLFTFFFSTLFFRFCFLSRLNYNFLFFYFIIIIFYFCNTKYTDTYCICVVRDSPLGICVTVLKENIEFTCEDEMELWWWYKCTHQPDRRIMKIMKFDSANQEYAVIIRFIIYCNGIFYVLVYIYISFVI